MDILVHQNNLQKALSIIERVTAKNAALPILNNVLLKTEGGRLKLSATNLEVGITSTIGAKVAKEGQVAVPGRIMADLARAARAETISLSVKQNVMKVDAGTYHTSVLCFDASEYPIIPRITGDKTLSIDAQALARLLGSVLDSIATSDARPEIAGALFRFHKDGLTVAATDGFRLVEHSAPGTYTEERMMIVPRSTVTELLRALADAQGDVEVRIADNQVAFAHDTWEVDSRLIDGRYPDYRKVIPEAFLAKALIPKDELANAIKVVALFSSSISDIKIECGEKEIVVSAKNASKGEGQAAAAANLKGDPFDISLNYHYLLDGLKVIPGEQVVVEFTGKGSAFVMRSGEKASNLVYVVMPLRG